MEVIVGTYDPLLLGFSLTKDPDNEKSYRFEPRFVDRGHAGCVKSVVCNEAGTIMASGSTDETIRLYSLKDHRELGALHQHEGSVTCLTFSGSTHMLSASEDKTICVYDTKSWECLKVLKGHKGVVNSVSVHPSGRLAMSVSKDKHLRTWNLVTGRSAYVTHIKEDATLIKWSPSGDCYVLVIGNKIVLYKLATASLSCTLVLPRPVLAVQFLTENYLVAGGEFDGIRVFDIEKEACIQTVSGHESRIKSIEVVHEPFPEESQRVAVFSVSSDGDLRAWSFNRENFEEEASLIARYEMNGRPTCLTVSHPDKPSKKQSENKESIADEQSNQENNNERRTRSESGDEPTKKKIKKKKKGSSKKKKKQTENHPTENETNENEEEEDQEEMQE